MIDRIWGRLLQAFGKRFVQIRIMKRPSIRYGIYNELLPSLFTRTPSPVLRKMLELPAADYQPQLNQDVFALLMNRFRSGFFVDIGANDGYTFSNTAYLEHEFGWRGILVEANEKYLPSLRKRTRSVLVNKAVASFKGEADFIDAGLYGGLKAAIDKRHLRRTEESTCIRVACAGLQEILDAHQAPEQIDFISVDVEGGELPIVEQMVGVDRRFRCGCVEYNGRMDDYRRMSECLTKSRYRIVWEGQTEQDLFFVDDLSAGGRTSG